LTFGEISIEGCSLRQIRLFILIIFPCIVSGSAISTIGFTTGTLVNLLGVSDLDPVNLTGLGAAADFSAGTSLNCTFITGDTCSATGSNNGFRLSWTLGTFTLSNTSAQARSLTLLTIDLASLDVVFDIANPSPGTPASGPGSNLTGSASGTAVGGATFTNVASVGGNPAQNDVFKTVGISFSPGLVQSVTATFSVDLDTALPEPQTATCAVLSILAFAVLRLRKRS